MRLPYLHGVAFGSAIAVGVMVALAVTLLPAVLGFAGRNIDRLHVPFVGDRTTRRSVAVVPLEPRRSSSGRGRRRSPVSPCCWRCPLRRSGSASASLTPATVQSPLTSRRAYDTLTEAFGAGRNGTLLVVADLTGGGTIDRRRAAADRTRHRDPASTPSPRRSSTRPPTPRSSAWSRRRHRRTRRPSGRFDTVRDDVIPRRRRRRPASRSRSAASPRRSSTRPTRSPTGCRCSSAPSSGSASCCCSSCSGRCSSPSRPGVMNLLSVFAAYGVISLAAERRLARRAARHPRGQHPCPASSR